MTFATCFPTVFDKRRRLPVDALIPDPIFTSTHAITIDAPPERVWPWIAQMGGGRAGWYSWDTIDNGGTPSATRVVPELQPIAPGDIMPALPGAGDAFVVAAVDPARDLVLTAPDGHGGHAVAWEHRLEPLSSGRTRLVARGRASAGWIDLARATPPAGHDRLLIERLYGLLARLPRPLLVAVARCGHRIMEARHLRGIRRRSLATADRSAPSSYPSAFKTQDGADRFLASYDDALKLWPVRYDQIDISGRFGTTHVIVSGPADAPPLVLLHGYMATSIMWAANIAALSQRYRVYAIDTMGQPGKSFPGEPIRDAADFVAWLTGTLDALHLDRISLMGMSFGGWLALTYAVAAPERVQNLVLLSPGGVLPIARQFKLRGMLMLLLPTRLTVNSFMRWAGLKDTPGTDNWRICDLMYLGLKHFRMPAATLRVTATPVSDADLRRLRARALLLVGEDEVLYDAPTALARARTLIPDIEGQLIPGCRHDTCSSQSGIVNARVLAFLSETRTDPASGDARSAA